MNLFHVERSVMGSSTALLEAALDGPDGIDRRPETAGLSGVRVEPRGRSMVSFCSNDHFALVPAPSLVATAAAGGHEGAEALPELPDRDIYFNRRHPPHPGRSMNLFHVERSDRRSL